MTDLFPGRHRTAERRHQGSAADLLAPTQAAYPVRLASPLAAIAIFTAAAYEPKIVAAQFVAMAMLLTLPGWLFIRAIGIAPASPARRCVYVVAASVVLLMLLGLLLNTVLPHVGDATPLRRGPLLVGVVVALVLLSAVAAARPRPAPAFRSRDVRWLQLAGLPLISAAGAERLDSGHGADIAIVGLCLAVVVVMVGLLQSRRFGEVGGAMILFAVALALEYSFSMRGYQLFGVDIQSEYNVFQRTSSAGIWHPAQHDAYMAMLSITILPTILAKLTGVADATVLKAVYPVIGALLPVAVYVLASRWLDRQLAFLAGTILIVQYAFVAELPTLCRQEVALLLFAAAVDVAFGRRTHIRARRVAFVFFGLGVILSHYSTAYIMDVAFLAAFVLVPILAWVVRPSLRLSLAPAGVLGILMLVGVTVLWNGPLTRSSSNLGQFVTGAVGDSALLNPVSAFQHYVQGFSEPQLSVSDYFAQASTAYASEHNGLELYPASDQSTFPVVEKQRVQGSAPLSNQDRWWNDISVALSQAVNLGAFGGIFVWLWRRRGRGASVTLGWLALVLLAGLSVIRTNAFFASIYNPDRLQLQGLIALAVMVAYCCAWPGRRVLSLSLTGVAFAAIGAGIVGASGIGGLLFGSRGANVSGTTEAYVRATYTSDDVAATTWLSGVLTPVDLLYSDRYGELPISAQPRISQAPFLDITPGTLDQRAWVFVASSNLSTGIARGSIAESSVTYEFPLTFLDDEKDLLYTNQETRVYR